MFNLEMATIIPMVILLTCWVIWKYHLSQRSRKGLVKKANIFDLQAQFFGIGIICSLSLAYFALDYTQIAPQDFMGELSVSLDEEIIIQIPRTAEVKKLPPPPPTIIEEIDEFDDDDEEVVFIDESIEETVYEEVEFQKPLPKAPPVLLIEEEKIPEIRRFVEQMPRFPGCEGEKDEAAYRHCTDQKLLAFLAKHLRYPQIAQENGIEGMCVVQFVIDASGDLTQFVLARDIGGGCGQESLRVIKLMSEKSGKWTPGKQGGRPVKVQYSLPVKFNLK